MPNFLACYVEAAQYLPHKNGAEKQGRALQCQELFSCFLEIVQHIPITGILEAYTQKQELEHLIRCSFSIIRAHELGELGTFLTIAVKTLVDKHSIHVQTSGFAIGETLRIE
jgi:hypothetical protein